MSRRLSADQMVGRYNRIFAQNVREHRYRLGVNQTRFAELVHTDQPNVSRWESGEHSPTVETLCRIAAALKIDPLDLLRETGS